MCFFIIQLLGAPPTIYDTLPFQSWHFGKYLVVTVPQLPSTIKAIYLEHQEKKAEEERIQKEEEEEIQRREDEKREKKERKKEKRRNFAYDEKTGKLIISLGLNLYLSKRYGYPGYGV